MNDIYAIILTICIFTIIPYFLGKLLFKDKDTPIFIYYCMGLVVEMGLFTLFGIGIGVFELLKSI